MIRISVEFITDGEFVDYAIIDGEKFESEEENSIFIPKGYLSGIKLEQVPPIVEIKICQDIQEGVIILSGDAISIKKINDTHCKVFFESSGRRKYWDGQVGFKLYMETKRDIIEERKNEINDVCIESYDDDGDYIFLHYSTMIEGDALDLIIQQAEQIIGEIDGAVEITIGSPFKKIEDTNSEADFTIGVLIPLIRKLGFSNVKYNHGKREYGKDIVFTRLSEFDEYEYWGVQVKYGDVSGGANSEIDHIIAQAEDAFKMPFYDVYTRSRQRISKLLVVISGKFTENAVEKVCEKIEIHALKNNIVFVDGEKINTLCERFRK